VFSNVFRGGVVTDHQKELKIERLLLFLLVVLAAAIRIFFLFKYENMGAGAAGNVERALQILENPDLQLNFDGNTSTLFKYMMASLLYFWRDPVLAPRALTSLFGIFLVVPYYGTVRVLFDRTIAFFSSLVLVFYPLHIVQSGVTTSDAVYFFFLFGSFYYYFSYQSGQKRLPALLLSALSFNIASLLRFESWVFIPIFFILLWPQKKKAAFLFGGLSAIFPCLHLMMSHFWGPGTFFSFTAPAWTTHKEIMIGRIPYDSRPWSWLAILCRSTGTSLVFAGVPGMVLAFLIRQKRQLAIFFLVLFSGFTINTLAARMAVNDRYSIILALLMIPYAWFFGDRFLAFLGIRRKTILALLLFFPAVGFLQVARSPIERMPGMLYIIPPEIKALGYGSNTTFVRMKRLSSAPIATILGKTTLCFRAGSLLRNT